MMGDLTIPIRLPERVWARLATRADDDGCTVSDLIAVSIMRELEIPITRPEPVDTSDPLGQVMSEIRKAHADGWRATKPKGTAA